MRSVWLPALLCWLVLPSASGGIPPDGPEEPASFEEETMDNSGEARQTGIGGAFHRETRYEGLDDLELDFPTLDPQEPIPLPTRADQALDGALGELLRLRRSRRNQVDRPFPLTTLAALLWATQGVTARAGPFLLRTAPSAGALHPIDTYLVAGPLEGLPAGIYKLDVGGFRLIPLSRGDYRAALSKACLGQQFVAQAPVSFVWVAVPERTTGKYEERGWRYIYMDAGHLAQNLYLASESLHLSCCTVGAFFDDALDRFLGLDGTSATAIYLGSVGPGPRE